MMHNVLALDTFRHLNVTGRMKHKDLRPVMTKPAIKNSHMAELYVLNTNHKQVNRKGCLG